MHTCLNWVEFYKFESSEHCFHSIVCHLFSPPFRRLLIHAVDIIVQHFLLFFAQIGDDALFSKEFVAQVLAQSKCMHIAGECTVMDQSFQLIVFKMKIQKRSPQLAKANILLE